MFRQMKTKTSALIGTIILGTYSLTSCGGQDTPVQTPDVPADVSVVLDTPELQDTELPLDSAISDPGPATLDLGLPPDLPALPDQGGNSTGPLMDTRPDRLTEPIFDLTVPADQDPGCTIVDGCPYDGDTCLGSSAVIEVIGLDIWAQPLLEPEIALSTEEGVGVTLYGNLAKSSLLCGPMGFELSVQAPDYEALHLSFYYDGSGSETSLTLDAPEDQVGLWHTTEIYDAGSGPTRYHTIWVGLPHKWFASTGYPARHGNDVQLLIDGEEAWHSFYADAQLAQELVVLSTWWWQSNFELYRHPYHHTYQSTNERYWNTIMGTLDYLDYLGVQSKILVNQFYSQDGIFSDFTVDTQLLDRAEETNDLIEYMGTANQLWGTFTLEFESVDFQERVTNYWAMSPDYLGLEEHGLPPFYPNYVVDMSDLPLLLQYVDFPHASWHQKFGVIDQEYAHVGGMNLTKEYWDTIDHPVFESRRMNYDATTEEKLAVQAKQVLPDNIPWKDYSLRIEGPVVSDVMRVFDWRWTYQKFLGVAYSDKATLLESVNPPGPPIEGGVQAQLVSTMPPPFYGNSIMETMLKAIAQAEDYILIEDQYFRAPILSDAIFDQMLAKPNLKLIVITNPVDEWTAPGCWPTYLEIAMFSGFGNSRFGIYQLKSFDWADMGCILCVDEVQGYYKDLFIHSKLVIIDDKYLQTGSANHNNRGLLYEGELAVVVFDVDWVIESKNRVLEAMLGSLYDDDLDGADLLYAFDNIAWWNEITYDDWAYEGFDLNLNGASPGWNYIPDGKVYDLTYGDPSDCFFEDIGPDMM
jgi:phosphatidylserine/phosphatidylglycerophosphate/cardiolipin synthase-like enzyme